MASNERYYWIKLKTDFFNQETVDFLLSQDNGAEYVVLYQMLCLKTANSGGSLATVIGDMIVPYDVKKIVRDCRYFDFDTVSVALELFKRLGLIYVEDDGILRIADHHTMVGSESLSREAVKKRQQRQRKTLEEGQKRGQEGDKMSPLMSPIEGDKKGDKKGTKCPTEYRDKSIEIRDKSIEIEDSIHHNTNFNQEDVFVKTSSTQGVDTHAKNGYQKVIDLFNEVCVSLPKVTKITEPRKKAIKRASQDLSTLEQFKQLFETVEKSDFLTDRAGKGWKCGFDWIMKPANLQKILEGNYNNRNGKPTMQGDVHSASYNIDEYEDFSIFDK